jgi:hypothetical protein
MKLTKITEQDQALQSVLDEARPMGFISGLGKTVASKLPAVMPNIAAKSRGKLITGKYANRMMDQYLEWLGISGTEATKENLLAWLKSKGYPTTQAEKTFAGTISEPTPPENTPTAPTAVTPTTTAATPTSSAPTSTPTATTQPTATIQPTTSVSAGKPRIKLKPRVNESDHIGNYLRMIDEIMLSEDTNISTDAVSQAIMAAAQEWVTKQLSSGGTVPSTTVGTTAPYVEPTATAPTSAPSVGTSSVISPNVGFEQNVQQIKQFYEQLDPRQRKHLRRELRIIDDRTKLGSGG